MSCAFVGVCRTSGGAPVSAPDKIENNIGVKYSRRECRTSRRTLLPGGTCTHSVHGLPMRQRNEWKGAETRRASGEHQRVEASNGEEIHSLWQSLRLLAYDTGTLQGTRTDEPEFDTAVLHAFKYAASWWLSHSRKTIALAYRPWVLLLLHGYWSSNLRLLG